VIKILGSKIILFLFFIINLYADSLDVNISNRNFFIEMNLSKSKIYRDESVLLSVYFRHKKDINLIKMEYEKPKFLDFFARNIGKEKIYQEGDFMVYNLNYMLTPKSSGIFTISPANINVATEKRELQKGGWKKNLLDWHMVVANSLKLEVNQLNIKYDIVGDFELKESIDLTVADINQPIRLTIKLSGEGNLDAYRGIDFDISNITVYADDANITSKLESNSIKSIYKKSFVFIATDDFMIPSKTIRIFNPKTKSIETLRTEAHRVTIKKKIEKEDTLDMRILYYLPLLTAFLFGIILTLLLQYLLFLYKQYRDCKVSFNGKIALQILYPHSGDSIEIEEMVRKLYAIKNGEKDIKIDKKELNKMLEEYSSKGE